MIPALQIDMTEWRKAAAELFRTSKRDLPDFLNGQALHVSIEAVRQTQKADAVKIAHKLGVVGHALKKVKDRKTGKIKIVKGAKIIKQDSYAAHILAAGFKQTGQWRAKGKTMDERVKNFINKAVRSVAYIKAGWIPARKKLFRVVRKRPANSNSVGDAKMWGKPQGYAHPAKGNFFEKLSAIIGNTAIETDIEAPSKTPGQPMKFAKEGLEKALNVCARDMLETLYKRLNPSFQKASGKP